MWKNKIEEKGKELSSLKVLCKTKTLNPRAFNLCIADGSKGGITHKDKHVSTLMSKLVNMFLVLLDTRTYSQTFLVYGGEKCETAKIVQEGGGCAHNTLLTRTCSWAISKYQTDSMFTSMSSWKFPCQTITHLRNTHGDLLITISRGVKLFNSVLNIYKYF